jgi:thiamine-phosphate pyrophosphorylase
MSAIALRGYYAILDVRDDGRPGVGAPGLDARDPQTTSAVLARAEELLAAAPCCLQLRAKRLGGGALLALARALGPLCRRAGVPFCVNDRLDVALAAGPGLVDLVHVGQDDLSLADVRRVLAAVSRSLLVGVSTHSLAQARAAVAGGADYIGFGPVFRTVSKERPDPVVGLAGLREVTAAVAVPVVAIGGITRATLGAVVAAGAAAAAVIADIDTASDRLAAAREVAGAFAPSPRGT